MSIQISWNGRGSFESSETQIYPSIEAARAANFSPIGWERGERLFAAGGGTEERAQLQITRTACHFEFWPSTNTFGPFTDGSTVRDGRAWFWVKGELWSAWATNTYSPRHGEKWKYENVQQASEKQIASFMEDLKKRRRQAEDRLRKAKPEHLAAMLSALEKI